MGKWFKNLNFEPWYNAEGMGTSVRGYNKARDFVCGKFVPVKVRGQTKNYLLSYIHFML